MGFTGQVRPRAMAMFEPQVYVITVQGALEPAWSDRLGDMAIAVYSTPAGPVTILTGTVVDQAALQDILKTVYDLGLPVVSVTSA